MNILFISLGCDKNLVDSEVMLGLLDKKGYQIVDSEEDADIIVVNTCWRKVFRPFLRWQSTKKKGS